MKNKQEELMIRVHAAKALVDATRSKDMELEAFMGLFHPKLQKNREYMARLRAALRKPSTN